MEKPWLQIYPGGVPANIDPDKYASVTTMVEECFQKSSDLPAFISMGKTLTFAELDESSRNFGAYLHSRGLEPGDRIALMMPNLLQYPIALFGALRAGLILVNTNPLYTPREMRHQFADSGAKAVIIAENFAANLQQIIGETQINTVIPSSDGEVLGIKGADVNFVVRHFKRMVPKYSIPNTVWFAEAVRQGRKFTIKPFECSPDYTVALQYTGGTTGVSKGAMLTHHNLVANMLQIRAWLSPILPEGEVVALCPLPMYHIFAFTVNCLAFMNCGARNILIVNARDLKALIKEWYTHRPNVVTGVNTLFNGLLNNPTSRMLSG